MGICLKKNKVKDSDEEISVEWWVLNKYIIEMSAKGGKTKRIGKHFFRLIGTEGLYFKGEHIVSFTPLPKRYSWYDSGKEYKTGLSCLSSTSTGNTTLRPSDCPLRPCKMENSSWKNMKKGQQSPSSKSLKLWLSANSAGSQTEESSQILWRLPRALRRLQGPHWIRNAPVESHQKSLPGTNQPAVLLIPKEGAGGAQSYRPDCWRSPS